MLSKHIASVALFLSCLSVAQSQIVITPGGGTAAVVSNLVGPGLTISGTPTINCDAQAYGSFSNGLSTNIGVSNGLLMTTGQAALAAGPNNSGTTSYCVGTSASDPQLLSLDSQANEDVCIIEFDVIPQCNQLTIRFVFGSEEYPEYVSSGYNDAFGFFVSGPNPSGGNYSNYNLARLPNNAIASIDNVNPSTNSAYYVNNTGGTTIQYDGFTTVLSPSINVVPCQTYHFKLAIADAGDCSYDSGVFIDLLSCSNVFTLSTTSTPENCGSHNGTATATVTGGVGPFSYNWSPAPGGGQGTANATGLSAGTYTVTVSDQGIPCNNAQTATVTIGSVGSAPNITVSPTSATVCSGTATTLTASGGSTYTWSPSTGLSSTTGATVTATPTTTTTYTVTGTGSCGTGTATTTITVNPVPTASASSNSPVCSGTTLTLSTPAVAGATYSWSGPNGFTSSSQNPSITNATTAASGTYTVTVTANGCTSAPSTVNVTVNATPTTTAGSNSPICAGSTLNLTATAVTGGTYSWTGPNGFTSTQQNPGITNATTAASGTYTVTPTANGCVGTPATVTVTVNAMPVANAGPDQAICTGASANLNATGGTAYSWSPATGLSNPNIANPVATPASTTTYTVTVTQNGCTATDQVILTVNSTFDATITPAGPFCADASAVTLTAVDGGGTWSGTGITNAGNGTFDPATAGPGTHTITYSIPGSCGDTQTTDIVVNALPTTSPTTNSPICAGDDLVINTTTSGTATFNWSGPNGFTSTQQNPTITAATTAASGTYSVTITDNGCSSTNTVTATINPVPSTTAGSNSPICEGQDLLLTATNTTGTSTFSWSGPNGFTSAQQNPSIAAATAAANGTYTVTISENGCSSTATVTATINPIADATINSAGPFCTSDAPVTLSAATTGGTWSGTGITDPVAGTFDPTVAGNNTVTITYTISGTCGDQDTIHILVSDQLDATITPVGPFCASNPDVTLAAVDGGGTWSGTGITNPATGVFSPSTAGAGTFTITYTIGGSCGDTQTTTIQVFADADATINPAGPFCLTDPAINLSGTQSGGTWSGTGITSAANGTFDPATAGIGTHTITYAINGVCGDSQTLDILVIDTANTTINTVGPFCVNAGTITLTAAMSGGTWSGTGITNATTGTFDPAVAGPGTHTITYTIGGNCGNSSTTTIVVNPLPTVTFTVDNPNGCTPVSATLTNTTPTTASASWIINGNNVSNNTTSYTGIYSIPGCYDVELTITDNTGCVNSATVNSMICVAGIPVADFSFSPTDATILNPVVNFTNQSSGATNYIWNFGDSTTSTSVNPSHAFPDNQPSNYQVCLTAINSNGCLDSTCQLITIYDEFLVYVPNAFTPDHDGKNEIFTPVVAGIDANAYEFYIFDRWGELIFSSQSPNTGWDGTYRGTPVKQDVYVWKLKVKRESDGKKFDYYGHVTLIK